MSRVCKLGIAEKLEAVDLVLSGKQSANGTGHQYGVHSKTICDWVRIYQCMGEEGFLNPHNKNYPVFLKESAVKDYLSGGVSLADICRRYGIRSDRILRRWIDVYIGHGEFRNPHHGGWSDMSKGRKTTEEERIEIVGYCIAHDKDYGKTIDEFGVSYQQVYSWVRKYEERGVEGLSDRRGRRKDEASMSELEKLQARIKLKDAENYRLRMENDLLKKLAELGRGWEED